MTPYECEKKLLCISDTNCLTCDQVRPISTRKRLDVGTDSGQVSNFRGLAVALEIWDLMRSREGGFEAGKSEDFYSKIRVIGDFVTSSWRQPWQELYYEYDCASNREYSAQHEDSSPTRVTREIWFPFPSFSSIIPSASCPTDFRELSTRALPGFPRRVDSKRFAGRNCQPPPSSRVDILLDFSTCMWSKQYGLRFFTLISSSPRGFARLPLRKTQRTTWSESDEHG